MLGLSLGFEAAKFIWHNRGAVMRAYHCHVKHKVMLDDLLDLAEEHPDHPDNKKERAHGSNKTTCATDP